MTTTKKQTKQKKTSLSEIEEMRQRMFDLFHMFRWHMEKTGHDIEFKEMLENLEKIGKDGNS